MTSDPLARLANETARANAALRDYVAMGPGRSLSKLQALYKEGATEPPTKNYRVIAGWSSKYKWQERVAEVERQQAAEVEAEWKSRQFTIRQADYETGQRLRQLAASILDEAPKFSKTRRQLVKGRDGEPDKEIITLGIDAKLMIQAIDLASKLERAAAEMAPPKQQQTNLNIDITQLSDEQLRRIADGDDPFTVIGAAPSAS